MGCDFLKLSISRILRFQKQSAQLYDQQLSEAAARCGLSRPAANVLIFLANNPEHNTARDIALCRGFSKAYVSRALDQLQHKGLVQTRTQAQDRRFQTLLLSPAAAEPVGILRSAQEAFVARLTQHIPSSDLEVALTVLDQVMANTEKKE